MLTRILFAASFGSRPLTTSIAALALLATSVGLAPARAEGSAVLNCVGSRGSVSCAAHWGPRGETHIRRYLPPRDEQLEREAAARERRWVTRCRPVLKEDAYGVSRYEYAAPGCEFGRTQE
jgi:hypothetical protein